MKRGYFIIFFILSLLFISGITKCQETIIVDKATAECIASKSTLYISTGCIACAKQEESFGENFHYLNIIDCKTSPDSCLNNNILRVPTWVINNQKIEGVQSIEKLKELTGC